MSEKEEGEFREPREDLRSRSRFAQREGGICAGDDVSGSGEDGGVAEQEDVDCGISPSQNKGERKTRGRRKENGSSNRGIRFDNNSSTADLAQSSGSGSSPATSTELDNSERICTSSTTKTGL